MRKLFFSFFMIPVLALANPNIKFENDDVKGEYTVSIGDPESTNWIKVLLLTPKTNVLAFSKESQERKYINCYESFSILLDEKPLIPESIRLRSNGSRVYAEDVLSKDDEDLNRIMNTPKKYEESFYVDLTNKNLKNIIDSSEISLKVCEETENFSPEEMTALKQTILKKLEK
ncbi:hypothetical protein ROV36_09135 [Pasteurella multocida]|uniref:hypothetical protein n=2 Tax=Pasteurella multocida TaxID=747 RepID=UPI0009F54708|nr:hypothetical protein [Pasteurella multocida]MEB3452643.1 hypothetical protein [Pasteurella multocida]MEB3455121.1 hypothetical protein [Pasteurella multocida]MEB3462379.1 hypothetical protein [Pasteurella multocida]PNM02407.1 hypothetical protein A6J89_000835 [Pasteurella multocida]URH74557.1 hypothetical protein M8331_02900 [Pasteurella multocida]